MEKKKLYARFYLNSIGWTKNTRVAPRILSRLTKYSTSKKKSHTERLICYLPIIFYPVAISAPQFFFTFYPNIPISLTSLLTAEQSKDFLYLFPINLFQSLPVDSLGIERFLIGHAWDPTPSEWIYSDGDAG